MPIKTFQWRYLCQLQDCETEQVLAKVSSVAQSMMETIQVSSMNTAVAFCLQGKNQETATPRCWGRGHASGSSSFSLHINKYTHTLSCHRTIHHVFSITELTKLTASSNVHQCYHLQTLGIIYTRNSPWQKKVRFTRTAEIDDIFGWSYMIVQAPRQSSGAKGEDEVEVCCYLILHRHLQQVGQSCMYEVAFSWFHNIKRGRKRLDEGMMTERWWSKVMNLCPTNLRKPVKRWKQTNLFVSQCPVTHHRSANVC